MRPIRLKYAVAAVIVVILGFSAYSGTFSAPFYLDDYPYILNNEKVRLFTGFWPPYGTRYAGFLSFALNYAIAGQKPALYHLVNISIHLVNGLLVFTLVTLIFRTHRFQRASDICRFDNTPAFHTAFLSALIFVLHPIETQAVTYITQRFTSLAALFYLSALVSYCLWRLSSRRPWFATALALAVLAAMTKETTATLPFMVVFFEFAFFYDAGKGRPLGRTLLCLTPFILTACIIPFFLFAPDLKMQAKAVGIDEYLRTMQTGDLLVLSPRDYLITQFRVIVTYLRLMVFPINQNLDYDYPVFHSFFEPEAFVSFLFLLAVFVGNCYVLLRSLRTKNGPLFLASCGIFWFFITLSVESSVIPIMDIIFEHRLYLPSMGLAASFSALALMLGRRLSLSLLAVSVLVLVFVALPLGVLTYKRNSLWRDKIGFFRDAALKSPAKARPHHALANALDEAGLIDDAIGEYEIALGTAPRWMTIQGPTGMENQRLMQDLDNQRGLILGSLGLAYYKKGRVMDAIGALNRAVELSPSAAVYVNLGNAYRRLRLYDKAVKEYENALFIKPGYAPSHLNLAVTYVELERREDAIEEFQKFIAVAEPEYASKVPDARAMVERLKLGRDR